MDFFTTQSPWYIPLALLLAALFVGLIKAYKLWEEMHDDDDPASDHERLSELEDAHYAGELDADELHRVRELLSRPNSPSIPEPPRRRPSIQPQPEPAPPSTTSNVPTTPEGPPAPREE